MIWDLYERGSIHLWESTSLVFMLADGKLWLKSLKWSQHGCYWTDWFRVSEQERYGLPAEASEMPDLTARMAWKAHVKAVRGEDATFDSGWSPEAPADTQVGHSRVISTNGTELGSLRR